MKTKRDAPTLRFPGFSDAWELTALSSIAKIYDGTHQTPIYVEAGIPFVSVEDIENILETTKFISSDAFEKDFKVKPRRDDILMTRIGVIGATAIIKNDDPLAYYVSLALIRPNPDVNSHFLRQLIASHSFRREVHERSIHVAFPKKINLGDIGECRLYLPSKAEQDKIGAFLSAVEEKIAHIEKKKELVVEYKKGVMQQIFNQEIRFKDNNSDYFVDWEERKIADLFQVTRGKVLAMGELSKIRTDAAPYPVYSSQTVNQGLAGYFSDYLFENCITWTTDGAGAGDVNFRKGKFYCTNVCGVLKSNIGYANRFIADLLNTKTRKHVSYVGNPKLMNNVMAQIKINIPKSINEQKLISNFFETIDTRVDLIEKELETMKIFKKGLLQQMFV
jgi:type I restriction enzyme, S subunit